MADSPYIKAFIIGVFVMILLALGTAGFRVFRKDGSDDSAATVRALTVRVALSFGLVIVIGVLYLLGIIEPNH
jgi:hypothetical protein